MALRGSDLFGTPPLSFKDEIEGKKNDSPSHPSHDRVKWNLKSMTLKQCAKAMFSA